MDKRYRGIAGGALVVAALLAGGIGSGEAKPPVNVCPQKVLDPDQTDGSDLRIMAGCTVGPGTYHVGNVNVLAGGTLTFTDPPSNTPTHFWAKSILVENGGALIAGSPTAPIGAQGGVVAIHLY